MVDTRYLQPPANDAPIGPDDRHSHAWLAHHQEVADRLADVAAGVGIGPIGEYFGPPGSGVFGTPVALTSGVAVNLGSLVLQPGDWEVTASVAFTPAPTTSPRQIVAGASATSATFSGWARTDLSLIFQTGSALYVSSPPERHILTVATTIYLVAMSVFLTSTMAANGTLSARRWRA